MGAFLIYCLSISEVSVSTGDSVPCGRGCEVLAGVTPPVLKFLLSASISRCFWWDYPECSGSSEYAGILELLHLGAQRETNAAAKNALPVSSGPASIHKAVLLFHPNA